MAASSKPLLQRISLSKSVDSVRWIPTPSAFDRLIAAAVHDPSSSTCSLDLLSPANPGQPPLSTWISPSRISSLSSPRSPLCPLALSTYSGSLHLLSIDPLSASVLSHSSIPADPLAFHCSPISAVDLEAAGRECVTVGEDSRVHLVSVAEGRLAHRRVHDGRGLLSHTAVRWASPREFATGGYGFGVQLWDPRKPEGMVAQLKGSWAQGVKSGIVHSIDVHPSRQHICMVGGSSGTVFAWDLRWQQQPILLAGLGVTENAKFPCVSEIWEVRCDSYFQSNFSSASSAKVLPAMVCSDDGFLTVLRQDEEPIELLAENCAINSFDIDPQNPNDVVCGLEWESILILTRPRESSTTF